MKRLITLFLVAAVTMFFYSCSENNSTAPELSQSDQVTSTLAKVKTAFTGTCIPILLGDPGTKTVLPNGKTLVKGETAEWYDEADDWRVTGKTFWFINSLIEADGLNTKLWGKANIIVVGENPGDDPRGTWNLSWHGYLTPKGDPPYDKYSHFTIVVDAVGQGKEGEVKGLVAKWTYKFDSEVGYFYVTEGFIH